MSLVQGHTLRPTPYRIMVMLKTSMPQGGYFKSPHISMTLRKDQANAMCAMETFFFWEGKWTTKSAEASIPGWCKYHTLFCAFLFLLPWDLMINSFKDHQRPNSKQWPNTWKSPPLPQNSRNNPPTHHPAHIFPATDTHSLSETAHICLWSVSFQINQCASYLSVCEGNVGGNTWMRGEASSGRPTTAFLLRDRVALTEPVTSSLGLSFFIWKMRLECFI